MQKRTWNGTNYKIVSAFALIRTQVAYSCLKIQGIEIYYGSGTRDGVDNRPYGRKYAFCMCNPPFYESKEEVDEGLENKELEPSSVSTMRKLVNYTSTHFDKDLHRFNKRNDHTRWWTTIYWSNHQWKSRVQGSNHVNIIIILWPWDDVEC